MSAVLDATEVEADLHTGCIVVGAGACGLVAALALADAGVETVVLERDTRATGSTSLSSGFIPAVGTRQQRERGIEDSTALFIRDIQHKANNEADPQLVEAIVAKSGPALDWLASEHGLEWQLLEDFLYPGHSAHRMHAVPEKTGAALQVRLLNAANHQGIDVITEARVDALVVKREADNEIPDGNRTRGTEALTVCGVRVVRPDGAHEVIMANAVILACNGYGGNKALMQRFIPEMADADYFGHCGNTGDAVIWGEELGAAIKHMGAYQGHGSVAKGHNILITWALMMNGGVQVNNQGRRFSNEHAGYSEQAVNVIEQPEQFAWNIYDQRLHESGLAFPDYQQAVAAGAVVTADDAENLARVTGLPAVELLETLKHIDKLGAQNQRDDYGREFNDAHRLKPPYYAIKVGPAVFHTQGGLNINQRAQVLDHKHQPIGNLLAAGGAACGVSGSSVSGYLSGNGLLTAVTLGLIAAETVVDLHKTAPS